MKFITTLTTKGQVVIPKTIRSQLGLKSGDKLSFILDGKKIISESVDSISGVYGMFKVKKPTSKKMQKKLVEKAVIKKFNHKN